jgi:hypothetical protein
VKDRQFLILPRQLGAGLRHAENSVFLARRVVLENYMRHFRSAAMIVGNQYL